MLHSSHVGLMDVQLSEATLAQGSSQVSSGVLHWRPLMILDRTQLPSWQLGLSAFLCFALIAIVSLVVSRVPNPELYTSSLAFVAIVSFFLVLYLEMARGWHADLLEILRFDDALLEYTRLLKPSFALVTGELSLAVVFAYINLNLSDQIPSTGFVYFAAAFLYWLQYVLVLFCVDVFFRQLVCLTAVCTNIRISLLEADAYAMLANPMLRFLKLYIFGLCIVFASYTVFTSGELAFSILLVLMMPFYLPGLAMLGLFMLPYNRFKQRIYRAKQAELNHVQRALGKDDKAHLRASLIGDDADKLTRVDLMYYEERIARIKELPFTDRIRSMLLFGVLPPLTWVIAALIEIFIEGVL